MRIYLIGKNGLLGKEFLAALSGEEGFELFALDKDTMDITDGQHVCDVFAKNPPDFVINCAAYTKVDDAEDNYKEAFRLNTEAPENLAKCCKREDAVLLHFSTDYVFDGEKGSGYFEDDEPNPIGVYGQSKLEGEKLVAEELSEHYIVRTSLLFGQHGLNFVDLMRRLIEKKDKLQVVGDKVASPTYAKDLAEACVQFFVLPYVKSTGHEFNLSEGVESVKGKPDFGLYHFSNEGACSRYELVEKIVEITGSNVKLEEVESVVFNPRAHRPANSELLSKKAPKMRSWQGALESYLG